MRQVDPMRESLKFNSCGSHENYLERTLSSRREGLGLMAWRGEKNLISNVDREWVRDSVWQ